MIAFGHGGGVFTVWNTYTADACIHTSLKSNITAAGAELFCTLGVIHSLRSDQGIVLLWPICFLLQRTDPG